MCSTLIFDPLYWVTASTLSKLSFSSDLETATVQMRFGLICSFAGEHPYKTLTRQSISKYLITFQRLFPIFFPLTDRQFWKNYTPNVEKQRHCAVKITWMKCPIHSLLGGLIPQSFLQWSSNVILMLKYNIDCNKETHFHG